MHQTYVKKVFSFVFIFHLLLGIKSFSQSIVLRPGIGKRYVHSKPDYSLSNNFDASFNGDYRLWEPTANIAVELLYPKKSYELVFTSQLTSVKSYTNFKAGYLIHAHTESGGISQFQFFYNRFFDLHNKSRYAIKPFVGAGIGMGLNRPKSFYDSSYFYTRFYSLMYPNEYIDYLLTYKRLAKFSYSLAIKAGITFTINKVERARLLMVYNFGLNKILRSNIVYYHTNAKYWGSYTGKGSQFSIMATVPIYLKRKKYQ